MFLFTRSRQKAPWCNFLEQIGCNRTDEKMILVVVLVVLFRFDKSFLCNLLNNKKYLLIMTSSICFYITSQYAQYKCNILLYKLFDSCRNMQDEVDQNSSLLLTYKWAPFKLLTLYKNITIVIIENDIFYFTQVPGATTYNLALYYMTRTPLEENPGVHRFVNGDDAYRNSRFKLIPHISKVSTRLLQKMHRMIYYSSDVFLTFNNAWNLLPQGSWIVKQSVGKKACLVGQALEVRYYRGNNYFEVIHTKIFIMSTYKLWILHFLARPLSCLSHLYTHICIWHTFAYDFG